MEPEIFLESEIYHWKKFLLQVLDDEVGPLNGNLT